MDAMDTGVDKVLVLERDDALREQLAAALSNAGYEVSTGYAEGMRAVLAFHPDAVIFGADPPQLDCCDVLSEIKGSEHTRNIRVVMLVTGGASERARALDLGADDALSVPFDPQELLSRLRSQIRNKSIADEARQRLHLAEENRAAAREVVTAVREERRTLRVGGLAIVSVLIVAGLALLFLYHRGQEQNTRVYAAITRLQSGVLTQQQLLDRTRRAMQDPVLGSSPTSDPQKVQLQKKSEDLKSKIAASKPEDTAELQSQLATVEDRLAKLESEGQIAQEVLQSYEPSVCLIHVVLGFRDHATGMRLRYANITSNGEPQTDEHNNPVLSLDGDGPEVQVDVFGTGFLAGSRQILTNHHVVEPWWQNDDLKAMLNQGFDPAINEMTAYFPGIPHGISVSTETISSAADVAVVKGNLSELGIKQIALAGKGAAVSGSPVLLLGYPTALDAILARAGEATADSVVTAANGNSKKMMEELAQRHLIRPIATQGHIGDVLQDKIVYDAQTTSGGSGGPLFNNEGKVIGINFAVVREFGGSNFAIPVAFGKSLLKP
jgi:DNA-binding response OmpR family regulator/S1-C subfamily serine protease